MVGTAESGLIREVSFIQSVLYREVSLYHILIIITMGVAHAQYCILSLVFFVLALLSNGDMFGEICW